MAIYHCSVKIISRSSGRSSVAAAAYRSGEKLLNQREGIEHDFTRKQGIEHSEIILPENAPAEYQSRETLWNAVELSEKRKDAQTAREIEVALPVELPRHEQIELVREYTRTNFTDRGMCADICIHDKGDGNPHAHIMLTMRSVTPEGFSQKCREWNDKKHIEEWRQEWAATCNRQFEKKNLPDRLDHRSYERQGKEQIPTIHLGTSAAALEKRGQQTERGKYNEEVRAANMEYETGLEELQRQITELKQVQQATAQQDYERQLIEKEKQERELAAEEERRKANDPEEKQRQGAELQRENESRGMTRREELQDTKKQDTGADPGVAARNSTGATAEQTAERLNSLKAEYVRIELQIQQTQQAAGKLQNSYRQLQSKSESIQEKAQTIDQYSKRIEQLKSDRAQLGIFAGKEKRAIDEQIKRLEQSKTQVSTGLQKESSGAGSGAALEQIQQQQATIKNQLSALPDTGKLKEQQAAAEQAYKQERAAAMQRPDKDRIQELTESRTQQSKEPKTMRERMAAAKAESKLQEKDTARKPPVKGFERGGMR